MGGVGSDHRSERASLDQSSSFKQNPCRGSRTCRAQKPGHSKAKQSPGDDVFVQIDHPRFLVKSCPRSCGLHTTDRTAAEVRH